MTGSESPSPTLADALDGAGRIVFFTGAGISTESGIADFRSPGGVWSRITPIEFCDFLADKEVRREDWRRRFRFRREFAAAQPNIAHRAIASCVKDGTALGVVTQNIDDLHQRAGVPRDRVIELHGNGMNAACLDCGRPHDLDALEARFREDEEPPLCDACGGFVKAAVISFGQPMPRLEVERAAEMCADCDVLVVVGSSLVVQPAATLPVIAKRRGADLVIVNREPTPLDAHADVIVRGEIGHAFVGVASSIT